MTKTLWNTASIALFLTGLIYGYQVNPVNGFFIGLAGAGLWNGLPDFQSYKSVFKKSVPYIMTVILAILVIAQTSSSFGAFLANELGKSVFFAFFTAAVFNKFLAD